VLSEKRGIQATWPEWFRALLRINDCRNAVFPARRSQVMLNSSTYLPLACHLDDFLNITRQVKRKRNGYIIEWHLHGNSLNIHPCRSKFVEKI
jgi:hypothetical protein